MEKNHFCHYYLHAFSAEELLKRHIEYCFKINDKQRIIMSKKASMLNSKIMREKMSPFTIYADFESILVPEDNEKQNPRESYTNKYQKHFAFGYGYELVCIDDKFSKPCKTYLDKDAVYNFINNMIEESKYCSDVTNKHFDKELLMTKEDNEDFKNSTKCWLY